MQGGTSPDGHIAQSARPRGLLPSFSLAYILAAVLLAALVWAGGPWSIAGNTRLLDILIRLGIVALTDAETGIVSGITDHKYLIASRDVIDWGMVVLAVLLLVVTYAIRGVRLHGLARFAGIGGTARDDAKASVYGTSVGAFFPFGYGQAATAAALEAQGAPTSRAAQAVFLDRVFAGFDIVFFALVGLATVSWATGLGVLGYPLLFLAAAWFLTRRRRTAERDGPAQWTRRSIGELAHDPTSLLWFAALSIVAFLLEVTALYTICQAFSSLNVLINVDFRILMIGLVAAHLASFIRVTPGGIGQYEWGMTMALYIGGVGFPEAVTIAILAMIFRYLVSAIMLLAVSIGRGVETGSQRVFTMMAGARQETRV